MTYEEYKAIGRCPRCGKEPFGHYVYCADCLYKMTVYRITHPKTAAQKARMKERHDACITRRREAGLCIQCGKPVKDEIHSRCTVCRAKNAVDAARRKAMRTDAPKAGNWRVNNLPSKQKPGADHPWRKYNKLIFERRAATVE